MVQELQSVGELNVNVPDKFFWNAFPLYESFEDAS
jgi:hypothetical protein